MSINLVSAVLRCGEVFRGAEKSVLLVLANYANEENLAWPSEPEIAWMGGVSDRSARRVLADLHDLAVIDRMQRGGRHTNRYRLNAAWLEEASAALDRTKQAAIQNGGNRHAAMRARAKSIRYELEQARNADPDRGRSWRERQRKAHESRRRYREKQDAAGSANITCQDMETGFNPDKETGLSEMKKICSGSGSPPSPDSSDANPDSWSPPSPDSMSPPNHNITIKKTMKDPSGAHESVTAQSPPTVPDAGTDDAFERESDDDVALAPPRAGNAEERLRWAIGQTPAKGRQRVVRPNRISPAEKPYASARMAERIEKASNMLPQNKPAPATPGAGEDKVTSPDHLGSDTEPIVKRPTSLLLNSKPSRKARAG